MRRSLVLQYLARILICILAFQATGCLQLDYYKLVNGGKETELLLAPNGKKYRLYVDKNDSIDGMIYWRVPYLEENGKNVQIGYTSSRGQVYASKEAFCILSFASGGGTLTWFEESFAFPTINAEEFDTLILPIEEEVTIRDETIIQMFCDRLLMGRYESNEDKDKTIEYIGRLVFYSKKYTNLCFCVKFYQSKKVKKYYFMDWSNTNRIECTDIIEQYLSEYFE